MRPINLFRLELLSALATPRKAALRIGLALLLGSPFALIDMPLRVRVGGLILLILFNGLFGAAVSAVRSRESGRMTVLRLLPLPGWLRIMDTALAGAMVDLLQSGPLIILFLLVAGPGAGPVLGASVLLGLLACLALLNLAGILLGSLVRTNAEVHLGGALAVGLAAFLSGLIPVTKSLTGLVAATASISPLKGLVDLLLEAAGQAPRGSGFGGPILIILGLIGLVSILARWINKPAYSPPGLDSRG